MPSYTELVMQFPDTHLDFCDSQSIQILAFWPGIFLLNLPSQFFTWITPVYSLDSTKPFLTFQWWSCHLNPLCFLLGIASIALLNFKSRLFNCALLQRNRCLLFVSAFKSGVWHWLCLHIQSSAKRQLLLVNPSFLCLIVSAEEQVRHRPRAFCPPWCNRRDQWPGPGSCHLPALERSGALSVSASPSHLLCRRPSVSSS